MSPLHEHPDLEGQLSMPPVPVGPNIEFRRHGYIGIRFLVGTRDVLAERAKGAAEGIGVFSF